MSLPYPGSNGVRERLAQPSHSTSWLSLGAFQLYGLCLLFLLIGYGLWRGVMFLLWRII